jgi:alpha-glucosidase (family GH31 glycosyl hydrolase)
MIKGNSIYDPLPLLTIKGMLFDSYMNSIEVELNTMKGENFTGIFGLGERANKNFFYEDGVYTIYAKDQGTPDEDGKAPSKGMYGVHPFYIFKHNSNSWSGVFTKVAQAQDWWIKNNKDAGKINIKSMAIGGVGDVYVFLERTNPESIIASYLSIVGKPVLTPQWALGWN